MKPAQKDSSLATLLLVAANLLIPAAILTFATGFFPYKPLLPGLARYEDSSYGAAAPAAPFDRVVFMVVDALRSDFVYTANSGFQFTQSLIRDGAALPFTAHATSPTVTMPRIKAITTGSIPSFLDVILNVDEGDKSSSLASQDTWLAQMKAKDSGKLVLYGDDTWLKLFPETFDRADGTSSFFVADYTEVDNNVTRHITDELKNDDWNTLVLHYLGLDHIGHKGGPRSPNMVPKQHEMDGIVKEIYTAISSYKHLQSTLLVLIGDHGMNDAGNHGASSAGETSPALVFMSPKLSTLTDKVEVPLEDREDFQFYSTIEQSDLAPTLGGLLGFPTPKNNLGAFISGFLPLWPKQEDRVQLLMRNAEQILGIITASFGKERFAAAAQVEDCRTLTDDVDELACDWQAIANQAKAAAQSAEDNAEWIPRASNWLRRAQNIMSSMASNYDMPRIILGQALAFGAIVCSVFATYLSARDSAGAHSSLALISLLYSIMMFASSYVEEEQQFWYWATSAWLASIAFNGFNRPVKSRVSHISSLIVAFVAFRILRSWNQTGQKFAGEPDLVKTFLHPNPLLLWTLVCITYLWIHRELVRGFGNIPMLVNVMGSTGLVLAAFTFKLAFTHEDSPELLRGIPDTLIALTQGATLVARARAVFIGLGVATGGVLLALLSRRPLSNKATTTQTLHHLYTLLALTQSRATNVPLFFVSDVVYKFLAAQDLALPALSAAVLLLQHASFFAAGGTNAISSVDLSSAYNGVSGFSFAAVGFLTFVGNWAAPIYWALAANALLVRRARGGGGEPRVFLRHACALTVFAAAGAASVMAACTVLRTHLFVWTVFSPKYLYCMAWSLCMHLGVNLGLGGVLFWLGTR